MLLTAIFILLLLMNFLTEYLLNKMMLTMNVLEKKNIFYHALCAVLRIAWVSLGTWYSLSLPIFFIGLSLLLYLNVLPYKNRRLLMNNFNMIIYLLYISLFMLVVGCMGLMGITFTQLIQDTWYRMILLNTTFLFYNLISFLLLRYRPGFLWKEDFDRLKVMIYTRFLFICLLYHMLDAVLLTMYHGEYINYLLLTSGDVLILILMFMFLSYNHIFVKSELMKKEYEESEILVAQQYFEKQSLKQLSEYDSLTSAFNRREICSIMEERMKHHQDFTCVFIDLDGLKRMNDTYGHSYGDEMLKRFADAAIQALDEKGSLARIGGDEFLLVFFNQNVSYVEKCIRQLQIDLLAPLEEKAKIYFSYGIASKEQSVEDYITSADEKMYVCKNRKRSDRV